LIDRRTFLAIAAGALLWPTARSLADSHGGDAGAPASDLDAKLRDALETSGFVYVSPLRSDGAESTCHGEVWFAFLDGAAVLNTVATTWKARAVARGLDRARVWVGDHGRWKTMLGRDEAFRAAPSFDARAELVKDAAVLDRLLAVYEKKYPAEIASWRDEMRAGFHDGSRVLIRYTPAARA
jgi:hypothetical protein